MLSRTRSEPASTWTERIRVSGIVQGVGFRPTVFRLATERGLCGTVCNDAAGVCILVAGERERVDDFVRALQREPPPLSRIDWIEREAYPEALAPGFHIIGSQVGMVRTGVTPDAATCAMCLAEIRDPTDRRYRYPFTNCTHCGPRFSIVRAVPYDRRNTSMDAFPMCPDCEREYHDPGDRRFHAQPNACPVCGPQVSLERAGGEAHPESSTGADVLEEVRVLLQAGKIVAIKGLGGCHLACDAANEAAVARLRARKHRYDKPFALMARDLAMIERYCASFPAERALLQSPAAPILLLPTTGTEKLAPSVAPGQPTYGFMLPYTPLHHLLLEGMDTPIVLTSGNVSDEPQCTDNAEARERLGAIADFLLLHNRDIVNRVDDSVVRVVDRQPRFLRRARGLAPASLPLPPGFDATPSVLALGGELKNTFCLLREGQAILSQHLGDLENARAYAAYRYTLDLYLRLFDHAPAVLAVDLHPDYLSSKLGREWAAASDFALVEVQHHHAHIAACLAENGVPLDAQPVLGVALDGLGYGGDGTLWGGEFLLADYRNSQRLAAFKPVPMPGGVQAIREPWRMAYAYLTQYFDWTALQREYAGLQFFQALQVKPLPVLDAMVCAGVNSPLTSSCGRLFDAVSALIGLRREVSYEGQAAIELEACIDPKALQREESYAFTVGQAGDAGVAWIETGPLWPALLSDAAQGNAPGVMAARFHKGLAQAVVAMVVQLTEHHGNPWQNRIALSGGVFQNAVLLSEVITRLEAAGLKTYSHSHIPANDGGLSLGQAVMAAARAMQR